MLMRKAWPLLLWMVSMGLQAQTFKPLSEVVFYPVNSASATALSLNNATISAQLQAPVRVVHVTVSQRVKQGDKLVTLDCADYDLAQQLAAAQVKAAEARLSLAQSQRQRSEQLVAKNLTSQEAADTVITEAIAREAELEQSRIQLRQAALDTSRCVIRAPYDGIVTARNIAEGQLAAVGSAVITIVETQRMELSANIDPADVALLQRSEESYFDFGSRLPVTISQLGGVVNSTTRNQEVRFQFVKQQPPPGAAGKLIWKDPRAFIPSDYIVRRGKEYGVFINEQGAARFVVLDQATPGRSSPVDLPMDTLIVTSGLGTLQAGDAL